MKTQKTNFFFYALPVMMTPEAERPITVGETPQEKEQREQKELDNHIDGRIKKLDTALKNDIKTQFGLDDAKLNEIYKLADYSTNGIKNNVLSQWPADTHAERIEKADISLRNQYEEILAKIKDAMTIIDVKLEDAKDGKHELVVACKGVNGKAFEWFRKGIESPEGEKGFFKMKYATSNPEVAISMPKRVNIDQQLPKEIFENLVQGESDLLTNALQKQLDQSRYQINLVGQADGLVGDYKYNLDLATKRAKVAKKALMKSYPWLDDKNFTITPKVVGVNGVEMKDGQKQENLNNLYTAWKEKNPDSKMTEKELIAKLGDYDDKPGKLNENEKSFFDTTIGNYRGVEATVASKPQPKPETPPPSDGLVASRR